MLIISPRPFLSYTGTFLNQWEHVVTLIFEGHNFCFEQNWHIQYSPFITPSLGPAIILALGGGGAIEGVDFF